MADNKIEMVQVFRGVLNSFGEKGSDLSCFENRIKDALNVRLKAVYPHIRVLSVREIAKPTLTKGIKQYFMQASIASGDKGYNLQCDWGYSDDR